jgi:hypothetical protein
MQRQEEASAQPCKIESTTLNHLQRSLKGRVARDMRHGKSVLRPAHNKAKLQTPRARIAVSRPVLRSPEICARVVTEPNPRRRPVGGAGDVASMLNVAVQL